MAAIYDKALKRKDYSGIVNKERMEEGIKDDTSNGEVNKKISQSTIYRFFILSSLCKV